MSCTATPNVIGQCENSYSELARDISEAANFATYFTGSPAAESTPHLYISALATWSQDTRLTRSWKNQFTRIPVFMYARGSIDLPLMTVSAGGTLINVAFSSDGMQIVSRSYGDDGNSVQVWDASTGMEKELKCYTELVDSFGFWSDGTHIVSISNDGSVQVWDSSTGVELKKLKGHTGLVDLFNLVVFLNDDMCIVSGPSGNSVVLCNASTGVELKELRGHTETVKSVAFSNDGTKFVSGSDDNSVQVWDVSTGMELKELKGHNGSVYSVAFSNDGTQIVSGSEDNSVWVWDVSTGVELKELKGHNGKFFQLHFQAVAHGLCLAQVTSLCGYGMCQQVWS